MPATPEEVREEFVAELLAEPEAQATAVVIKGGRDVELYEALGIGGAAR